MIFSSLQQHVIPPLVALRAADEQFCLDIGEALVDHWTLSDDAPPIMVSLAALLPTWDPVEVDNDA
jgi:hypothetical protein